jgi:hypothetical protein
MGGIGSGRYNKYKTKPSLANYLSIDLRKINKVITLYHLCGFTLEWNNNGVVTNSVNCIFDNNILELYYSRSGSHEESSVVEHIELTSTPCNFGGERSWFVCPGCKRKALILYGANRFRCRKCTGCYHPSSSEGDLYRATRAMCSIQAKLNGSELRPFDGIDGLTKPKWMRHNTYFRLHHKAFLKQKKLFEQYTKIFGT